MGATTGYADLLAVDHLTREAAPGTLHDVGEETFRWLGVTDAAQ